MPFTTRALRRNVMASLVRASRVSALPTVSASVYTPLISTDDPADASSGRAQTIRNAVCDLLRDGDARLNRIPASAGPLPRGCNLRAAPVQWIFKALFALT